MFNRKTNKIDLAIDKIISVQQQQLREKKMARKRPQPYSVLTERAAAKWNRNTKKNAENNGILHISICCVGYFKIDQYWFKNKKKPTYLHMDRLLVYGFSICFSKINSRASECVGIFRRNLHSWNN